MELNKHNDRPIGLFPNEECRIKALSFFIPIEVKYIEQLDRIFERINYNTKGIKYRNLYKSLIEKYSNLELNKLSWQHVFSINYSQINKNIDYFTLRIFRLTEALIFLQIDFDLSDDCGYHFWKIIRKQYEGVEVKKKYYKEIYHNDAIQRIAINNYLDSIEKECKEIVDSYIKKYYFFDDKYKYPCIKTFYIHKITEDIKYIDSFWINMGIDDRNPNYFESDDKTFLLKHDYEKNVIHIFVNYRKIIFNPMYGNIENQIKNTVREEILPSFGPSIAISEIYNYLYVKYRQITKKKKYYKKLKNALLLSNLLKYIYEFSQELLSEDIFVFKEMDLYFNNGKKDKTYINTIKDVLARKKNILDNIYEKENRILSNVTN